MGSSPNRPLLVQIQLRPPTAFENRPRVIIFQSVGKVFGRIVKIVSRLVIQQEGTGAVPVTTQGTNVLNPKNA